MNAASPGTLPPTPIVRAPVLLVDDRADDLNALKEILNAPDIEPVLAHSGTAALRQLLDRDFALILLDVNMPGMSGFEVAEIIKQRERTRETPILFLTAASSDVSFIYRAYSAGAVDFLEKPIDRDVVRAKVAVFVDLFKKAEALRAAEQRERDRQLAELAQMSERRYRNLAEAIPQIVWTADKRGVVTYYNRRFTDLTGLPAGAAASEDAQRSWTAAVHADDLERCEAEWCVAVESGATYESEFRLLTRDGGFRWHLCRAVPDLDAAGAMVGWLGTHTDCHDLHLAAEEAKKERSRATFLAEASELLSASLDYPATLARVARLPVPRLSDWCVVEVSTGTLDPKVAVAHVDEAKEARLRELHMRARAPLADGYTSDVDALDDADAHALAELGAASTLSLPLIVRDREIGAMTFGSLTRVLGEADRQMATDLARHAALAVDNARLYLSVQHALHARDEFLSIAAHELRTPLTTLLLQLQSLQRRTGQADARDYVRGKVDSAVRQTQKLSGLTERLLDVSRIVAGRLKLECEEVDLAELVKETVDRYTPEAIQAGCAIELDLHAARGCWDRLRLEQIMTNLLSNAFKYGRGAPVQIALRQGTAGAAITVHDHGIGIAPQDLARIFERFERAVAARQYGGLGIGLYVARQIVEAHGGSILVKSEPGLGSEFRVELPLAPRGER